MKEVEIVAALGAVAAAQEEHAANICVVTLAGNTQLQMRLSTEVCGSELIQRVLAAAQLEPESYGVTLLHEGQTVESDKPLKQAGIVPGKKIQIVQAVIQEIRSRCRGQISESISCVLQCFEKAHKGGQLGIYLCI